MATNIPQNRGNQNFIAKRQRSYDQSNQVLYKRNNITEMTTGCINKVLIEHLQQ